MSTLYEEVEKALNQLLDLPVGKPQEAFLAQCAPEVRDFIQENYALEKLDTAVFDETDESEAILDILGSIVPEDNAPEPRTGEQVGEYLLESRLSLTHLSDVYRASKACDQNYQYVLKFGLREDSEKLLITEHDLIKKQQNNLFVVDPVALEEDHQGHPYLVTRYVPGVCLDDFFEKHSMLRIDDILNVFADLCETVAVIHRENCVHRDLKPNNVVVAIQSGKPYPILLDFGIAASLDPDVRNNPQIIGMGTERYAAPERRSGELGGVESDLYSLGVMLAQALSGKEADWQTSEFTDRDGNPLARDLAQVLLQCLAEDPNARYHSAYELANDLRRLQSHKPISAWSDRPVYRLHCFLRRNPVSSGLTVLLILLSLFGFMHLRELKEIRRFEDIAMGKASTIAQSMSQLHRTSEAAWKYDKQAISKQFAARREDVENLRNYVQQHPNQTGAGQVAIGWAHYQLGDYEKAMDYLEAAGDSQQVVYPYFRTLANLALYEQTRASMVHFGGEARIKRASEANKFLKAAQAGFHTDDPALPPKDRDYLQVVFQWYETPSRDRAKKTLSVVEAMQTQHPTDARYHVLRSRIHLWLAMDQLEQRKDFREVLAQLDQAASALGRAREIQFCQVSHHTDLAAIHHLAAYYGRGSQRQENLRLGIDAARTGAAISPRDPRARVILAALLSERFNESDMLLESRSQAERALDLLNPDSSAGIEAQVVWMNTMGALARESSRELALEYLQRAAEVGSSLMKWKNPESAHALARVKRRWAERALLSPEEKEKLWAEAIEANKQAAAWDPYNPTYMRHNLFIYADMIKFAVDRHRDPNRPYKTMVRLMENLPRDYYAHTWMGDATAAMGLYHMGGGGDGEPWFKTASNHLESAITMAPEKTAALKNAVYVQVQWAENQRLHGRDAKPMLARARRYLDALKDYDRYPYYEGIWLMAKARFTHAKGGHGAKYLDRAVTAFSQQNMAANMGEWRNLALAEALLLAVDLGRKPDPGNTKRLLRRAKNLIGGISDGHQLHDDASLSAAWAQFLALRETPRKHKDFAKTLSETAHLMNKQQQSEPTQRRFILLARWASFLADLRDERAGHVTGVALYMLELLNDEEPVTQKVLKDHKARLLKASP